jgi:hypothetical protein
MKRKLAALFNVPTGLTLARAGTYDDALAVIESARCQMPDAALDSMTKIGEKSRGEFADLAVRTGEPDVAREVLAGTMAPAEIEAHIADWSRKMGWAN